MKKGLAIFFKVLVFIILLFPLKANALTFKVEKSVDSAKPGSEVTVYVKTIDLSETEKVQKYDLKLNYDGSKLEFKSASSGKANIGNSNPISITEKSGTLSNETVATIVFKVKSDAQAGDANLTISGECYLVTDLDKPADTTFNSSSVKVTSLSSDASLSSLKIPNATLSPKFEKNVTEYKTSIKDITDLTVNATPTDSNAKVMISDNYKALVKGENEIKVVVTAEDKKTTKTYIVKVTLTMTPTDEELLKANATLSKLEIENFPIEFEPIIKKYTLTVPYDIKKINIIAESENPKASIEMEGTTNLKVGRNTIKVVVTSEDKENKENYVLTVTREEEEQEVIQTCPDEVSKKEWIMFSVSLVLTFTLGIVLGYFLCKKEVIKKLFKKEKKEDNEEKLSDTIEVKPVKKNKKTKKIEEDFEETN